MSKEINEYNEELKRTLRGLDVEGLENYIYGCKEEIKEINRIRKPYTDDIKNAKLDMKFAEEELKRRDR